jgi:hypothetical protein
MVEFLGLSRYDYVSFISVMSGTGGERLQSCVTVSSLSQNYLNDMRRIHT